MATDTRLLKEAAALVKKYGSTRKAAAATGIPKSTLQLRTANLRAKTPSPPLVSARRTTQTAPRRHLIIPDTQVRPDVPVDHMEWIGKAIAEYAPDVIVHLGDHWDHPSLNSHEKPGSVFLEGRRYNDDVRSGNEAFAALCAPVEEAQRRNPAWKPEKHFLLGNHDIRPDRAANNDPKLLGAIGSDRCNTRDWKRHPFLQILNVDNICYSHYFQQSHSDRAIGGAIPNKLTKIGSSFVHGHVQGIDIGTRMMANGKTLWGISAGSAYLHEEEYRGAQGQRHFRGLIVLNEVFDGECCPMVLSLDYLCRKYTGKSLKEYMAKKYPGVSWAHL